MEANASPVDDGPMPGPPLTAMGSETAVSRPWCAGGWCEMASVPADDRGPMLESGG